MRWWSTVTIGSMQNKHKFCWLFSLFFCFHLDSNRNDGKSWKIKWKWAHEEKLKQVNFVIWFAFIEGQLDWEILISQRRNKKKTKSEHRRNTIRSLSFILFFSFLVLNCVFARAHSRPLLHFAVNETKRNVSSVQRSCPRFDRHRLINIRVIVSHKSPSKTKQT